MVRFVGWSFPGLLWWDWRRLETSTSSFLHLRMDHSVSSVLGWHREGSPRVWKREDDILGGVIPSHVHNWSKPTAHHRRHLRGGPHRQACAAPTPLGQRGEGSLRNMQTQMMASMIRAAGKGATKTNGPRVARARRSSPSLSKRVVRVHAEEEEKESETTEVRFNLGEAIQSESTNAARGYTAEDSAGQENIFAIEPRVYVAGSEMDDGQGQGGSFVWAVLGIITFGLVTTMMFLVREENATPVEGEKVEEASVSTIAVETAAAERVEEEASQVAPDVAAE